MGLSSQTEHLFLPPGQRSVRVVAVVAAVLFVVLFIGRRNDISDRVKLVLQILVLLLELVDFVQQVLLYMLNPLGRSHFFHTG